MSDGGQRTTSLSMVARVVSGPMALPPPAIASQPGLCFTHGYHTGVVSRMLPLEPLMLPHGSPDDTPAEGSITAWIAGIQNQDSQALQQIWERYYVRLVDYARKKLSGPRRVADEEDVVLSALDSFYGAAQARRFPQLADREDLWRILLSLTMRKAIDANRHARRAMRGSGDVRGESVFGVGSDEARGLEWLSGNEPTPELAACWTEEFDRLLQLLDDDRLRRVALAKLEGCTIPEVAQREGCAERTVVRCLAMIRAIWQPTLGE